MHCHVNAYYSCLMCIIKSNKIRCFCLVERLFDCLIYIPFMMPILGWNLVFDRNDEFAYTTYGNFAPIILKLLLKIRLCAKNKQLPFLEVHWNICGAIGNVVVTLTCIHALLLQSLTAFSHQLLSLYLQVFTTMLATWHFNQYLQRVLMSHSKT